MKKISRLSFLTVCCLMALSVSGICEVSSVGDLNHKSGKIGKYHALIIAIDRYQDSKIPELNRVSVCAGKLASVLKKQYGFSTDLILNKKATKATIEKKINALKTSINKEGSVLIYFAGRGEVNTAGSESWWYPVDAKSGSYDSYVNCETVQSAIRNMRAKDVFLIADSGYADSFFGSVHKLPKTVSNEHYMSWFNKRSRWAMTSGNDYPDSGSGTGCSTFSSEIIKALSSNTSPYLSILQLNETFRKKIRKKAFRPPRCRSLQNTGDRGGEMVFILKSVPEKPVAVDKKQPGKKKTVKKNAVPEQRIGESYLLILSDQKGAVVIVDGVKIGKTPLKQYAIQPGAHKVEIQKEGYLPFTKNVIVKRGATVKVTSGLEKKKVLPTTGTLVINSAPESARVRFVGSNLKYDKGMQIAKGNYKVEVSARYFDSQTFDVEITPGKESSFDIELNPVKSITLKSIGKFVLVEPGSFMMGSPKGEPMRNPNETQHKVTMTRRVYMLTKEVTVGQWRNFIQSTRYKTQAEAGAGAHILVDYTWEKDTEYSWGIPGFPQNDDHPVVAISWNDTQAYVKWLNKKGGNRLKFRLPTEAEWEYACRAGSEKTFAYGDCLTRGQANFDGNSKWGSCPVGKSSKGTLATGSLVTNAWGLYDMHGNVKEWCQDWFGNYPSGDVTDPTGPASGSTRVIRGGGWTDYIYNNRSAKRMHRDPGVSYSDTGFRLVLEIN